MTHILIKLLIPNAQQVELPEVRARYGMLAGVVGIVLNLCLFAAKMAVGLLSSSISVMADAFNNLSDAASNVVVLIGLYLAGRPADREHPFGHGRMEYLAGLGVSVAILLVGFELGKSSVEKIFSPQITAFSTLSFAILLASIAVKLWMYRFQRMVGNKLDSSAIKASSMDSLSDAAATLVVMLGAAAAYFWQVSLDGWLGLLVSAFILFTGVQTAKESLSPLLGTPPDAAFVQEITQTVLSHDRVMGLHDLIVHDYGPGQRIVSLHCEVPAHADFIEMHEVIDRLELILRTKFNCEVTIHMDPVETDNAVVNALRVRVEEMIRDIHKEISIHDFRVVQAQSHTNLVFDVQIPHGFCMSEAQVAQQVRSGVQELDASYFAVIRVEKAYI